MAKDFYKVLDVSRSADEKDIKSAYRRLARKYHPDVNPGDKAAEARFKEISEAYEVIGDPEKRKLYDQYGDQWERVKDHGDPGDFGGFRMDGGGFESIFSQFFGGGVPGAGAGRQAGYGQGGGYGFGQDFEVSQPRDIERTIELTLEEIDTGTSRTLTYQTMDAQRTRGDVATVPTTKKVEVKIPAGIAEGKKLRVPGKGHAGASGRAGDLYVVIKWAKHDRFRTAGENLEVDVPVSYITAALGGEIKVPTLRSNLTMKIPAGAQSGQTFRLANQGISNGHGGRTDLMAKLKITVPKTLTSKERVLLTELQKLEEETR